MPFPPLMFLHEFNGLNNWVWQRPEFDIELSKTSPPIFMGCAVCICMYVFPNWQVLLGQMRGPTSNLFCRHPLSLWVMTHVVQAVGGNFPHQARLMIARQVGQWDSSSAPRSQATKALCWKVKSGKEAEPPINQNAVLK